MNQTQDNSIQKEETDVKNNVPSFKLHDPVTVLNTNLITSDNLTTSCAQDSGSLSFVVLGKDSMDIQDPEAQASLLASYVDIRQKSMSIDYKSMVSSMSAEEMQQRLTEILEENVKLKETLKQNNVFMMQNFNKLMSWQEEVTKVHDNHKQKFAETRELIKHLKKENAELKAKIAEPQYSDSMGFEAISRSENLSHSSSTPQAELEQSATPTLVETVDNSCATSKQVDEEHPCDKLESSTEKELQCVTEKLSCSQVFAEMPESHKCSETCSTKDERIADLQKAVALLEQKLQCAPAPIQQSDVTELSTPNRDKLTQLTTRYNDTARELTECLTAQIERFTVMEQILKESVDALTKPDDSDSKEGFPDREQKLCHYCKQLVDQQVKIITDKQTLIKSQNQFHRILSEYKSVLYELEVTSNENAKLKVLMEDTARENSKILEQAGLEERALREEKTILEQERNKLEEEKLLFEKQKKSLEAERESFHNEKQLLAQEKIGLNEEKMSLDQQSYLYENSKKMLEEEKKILDFRWRSVQDLEGKSGTLQQKLQTTNKELAEVLEQVAQQTEEINLLKTQLKLYEEDFEQERKLKESLLEKKNKLEEELQKQVEFNKKLQSDNAPGRGFFHVPRGSPVEENNSSTQSHSCPKCAARFQTLQALLEHVEQCIDALW